MNKFLLSGVLASTALALSASQPGAELQVMKAADVVKETNVKNTRTDASGQRRLAKGVTMSTKGKVKTLHSTLTAKPHVVQRPGRKAPAKAAASEGSVLFESFENWDGKNYEWTPDGWTVDMRGDVERSESWTPASPADGGGFVSLPAAADGQYYYGINYSAGNQDEWLISPAVKVEDNFFLSFYVFLDPIFLFNLDDEHVDWDNGSFIGEPEASATLQVWAQPEGGDWTMLHDFLNDYKHMSINELFMATPAGLERKTFDLSAFAGKETKVAFRYVGTDGNTMFIDAISVGYPSLEDVSYMAPFETQYWGFDRSVGMNTLAASISQYPVFAPLTWQNMSWIDGASYTWSYCDPVTAEMVDTDEDPDMLTLTYIPDYSSEATKRNNFFYPPVLTATAPMASPGSYSDPVTYFQAGGKFERPLSDGTMLEGALLPFNFNQLGLTWTSVDDETIGDMAIPVFGYNSNVDRYWLNYSLNGQEPSASDYHRLEGIANMIWPSAAPLVVNGVTVNAWGSIGEGAEITASIYAMEATDEGMVFDYATAKPLATATIGTADILAQYNDGSKGFLCLPFDFDTPAIVQQAEGIAAYLVLITGFNSDKVEYFAPLQSNLPDPNYLSWGYVLRHINMSSHVQGADYYALRSLTYMENGEYVDLYSSFTIGLNAEYPWLTTDCEGIELASDGTPSTVALGSYYDGADLTVEAPAGVTASVAGRYDECLLTLAHNDAAVEVDGNVTVKGHGVEVSIPVKAAAGIGSVTIGSDATVTGIYDLTGRRIDAENAKGVFIAKYSDGTTAKIVK